VLQNTLLLYSASSSEYSPVEAKLALYKSLSTVAGVPGRTPGS